MQSVIYFIVKDPSGYVTDICVSEDWQPTGSRYSVLEGPFFSEEEVKEVLSSYDEEVLL
jgi:hypothetical protein